MTTPPTASATMPAVALGVATIAGLAATVGWWTNASDQLSGLLLATCLGGIGLGMVGWARTLPVDHAAVQLRESLAETPGDRSGIDAEIILTENTLGRRPALRHMLGGALAALGVAVLSPLRFLGPTASGDRLRTSWTAGARVVSASGTPILAAEGRLDELVTAFPEGHTTADDSQIVLLRLPTETLTPVTIGGGAIDGWVAYSKICTHAGCSVGLFGVDDREPETIRQLVCPCHQSVFDPTNAAKPVGGPAPRPLPQLPLAIDNEGYLIATADFDRPVGPAAWSD